jgi:fumarate hydratase subunit alpha
VVLDPLERKNSGDNTPAAIHVDIVPGDRVKIGILPKGGGGENSSALKMFDPTTSKKEILDFIIEKIRESGPKACPPGVIGVGIGGTFDSVAGLAKKALLRPLGKHHHKADIANFEKKILQAVNRSGVGPMGLGGRMTALAVHVETAPCHIASLPVAINFECHAHRYKEKVV